jgi:hypothetical protein
VRDSRYPARSSARTRTSWPGQWNPSDAPCDARDEPFEVGDEPFEVGDEPFEVGDEPPTTGPVPGNIVTGGPVPGPFSRSRL